jgi:hypothetical protein
MAINDPVADVFKSQQNPFVGIYSNPITEAKKKKMVGLSGPKDVVAGKEFFANGLWDLGSYNTPTSRISGVRMSEEPIAAPDAQNTAQRSKGVSSGMKDAYDAVAKAKDLIPKQMSPQEEMFAFESQKQDIFKKYATIGRNPFSGEKAKAFDAAMGKGEITPKLQGIINDNMAEFQAVSEIIDRNTNPQKYSKMGAMDMGMGGRELMPMAKTTTIGQKIQKPSTFVGGKQNISKFETMQQDGKYDTSTQAPLNLPMTQGQLDEEEAAKARAIIENHSQGYNQY